MHSLSGGYITPVDVQQEDNVRRVAGMIKLNGWDGEIDMRREGLTRGATIAVEQCLGVKAGEVVLVVCDRPCRTIGRALFRAAVSVGADAQLVEMLPRAEHGVEPPPTVAAAMAKAHVVFAPTSKSLTHTEARRNATKAGARVATLPGITKEIMSRALLADYRAIERRTLRLAERLRGRSTVRVTTPAGTDIAFSIAGREPHADTGIVRAAGITNLPAGEAFLAPVEGTGEGVVAVDGSIGASGILDGPVIITVEKGYATEISGHRYAKKLAAAMRKAGPEARNLAELGIGTNDAARLVGNVLEDEKVLGTVHLAFGDNRSMGGNVRAPFHQDGILLMPTVWVDGECILREGKLLVHEGTG